MTKFHNFSITNQNFWSGFTVNFSLDLETDFFSQKVKCYTCPRPITANCLRSFSNNCRHTYIQTNNGHTLISTSAKEKKQATCSCFKKIKHYQQTSVNAKGQTNSQITTDNIYTCKNKYTGTRLQYKFLSYF